VLKVGKDTEFRVGDGLQGNKGFGTGTLLVTMRGTTGFTADDINVHLVSEFTDRPFLFG
jgi:hypothetical protein